MRINKRILFIIFGCSIFLAVSGYYSHYLWRVHKFNQELAKRKLVWQDLGEKIKAKVDNSGQDIGLLIKDCASGWEISVNKEKLFPSASLVKVPIMASVFSASAQARLDLASVITLDNQSKTSGSGVLKNYAAGTSFDIEKLIEIMITESDNTATNMLIDHLGIEILNDYFKKIGLSHTNLSRKMMDFVSRQKGLENYTCAQDLGNLLEQIYFNKLINKEFSQKCLEILKKQKIKDRIPARLPTSAQVAHKTGLERHVCHDAGIVFTSHGDFIICVLTKHNYKVSLPSKKLIAGLARDVYCAYQSDKMKYPEM